MLNAVRRYAQGLARYVRGYFDPAYFTPARIPRLSLEVTNLCDSRCVFCANTSMRRPRQSMDMAIFKKAVDEYAAWGGHLLDFNSVIGDPLLDPHLLERLRYVRSNPKLTEIGFVTNAQWLHSFPLDAFFDSGITWLGLSLVLSGRDDYRAFFGVDRYETVLQNLERLIVENKRRHNPIKLCISLKPTAQPLSAIVTHPDFKRIDALGEFGLAQQAQRMSRFVDDWSGVVRLPGHLRRRPLYPRLFRPCRCLFSGMVVFSNGAIGLCLCRDVNADSQLILGNVGTLRLEDAWNSPKAQSLRVQWRRYNTMPVLCRRCSHYLP